MHGYARNIDTPHEAAPILGSHLRHIPLTHFPASKCLTRAPNPTSRTPITDLLFLPVPGTSSKEDSIPAQELGVLDMATKNASTKAA